MIQRSDITRNSKAEQHLLTSQYFYLFNKKKKEKALEKSKGN